MTPYIGEIRIVGFTFPPVGWQTCDGRLLAISEYDTLFALLGTTYGGDGQTTFGLPDYRSRIGVGTGQGLGLSNYVQGQAAGSESVTLTQTQLPAHSHQIASSQVNATTQGTRTNTPSGNYLATSDADYYGTAPTAGKALGPGAVSGNAMPAGGSQPHENLQPVLALNYIIATEGIFPPQS
jgi:microcystin-dependent protein